MDAPQYENIPAELKKLKQWVGWRYLERDGKQTKTPITPHGVLASSTNPATWVTFDVASVVFHPLGSARTNGAAGIGFVFTADDPYLGIDLDDCFDGRRQLKPDAQRIAQRFCDALGKDVYIEFSPSGKGLHIITRAQLPDNKGVAPTHLFGVYSAGRYFTMTGNVYGEFSGVIGDGQAVVDEICAEIASERERARPTPAVSNVDSGGPLGKLLSWRDVRINVRGDAEPPFKRYNDLIKSPGFAAVEKRRTDKRVADKSESAYDMALARLARTEGWNPQEIVDLLIYRRAENGLGKTERLDYYQRTIFNLLRVEEQDAAAEVLAQADTLDEGDRIAILDAIMAVSGLRIHRIIQHGKSPASYSLWLHSVETMRSGAAPEYVTIPTSAKLREQSTWQDIAQEHLRIVMPSLKPAKWREFLTGVLKLTEYEHIDDASDLSLLHSALRRYADQTPPDPKLGDDPEWVEANNPFYSEDGVFHFSKSSFQAWLALHHKEVAISSGFIARLRSMDASSGIHRARRADGSRVQRRYWHCALDADID